jgi:hypothetical protein
MLGGRGIPAAVIDGLAVSLRGQPRMTVDVDLIVLADVEQAVGLVRDLLETPFEPLFPGVEEVVSRSFILPMRSIIATQGESLDWDACLDLARQLGAAIDVDIASRLQAARR